MDGSGNRPIRLALVLCITNICTHRKMFRNTPLDGDYQMFAVGFVFAKAYVAARITHNAR
jgi:hypothetical protein